MSAGVAISEGKTRKATYDDEVCVGRGTRDGDASAATPSNHTRGVADESHAEGVCRESLLDHTGEEGLVRHLEGRTLLGGIASEGTRDGRVGHTKDAVCVVVAVPVCEIGKANLLLLNDDASDFDVTVSHRARRLLARAIAEGEMDVLYRTVLESVNEVRAKGACLLRVGDGTRHADAGKIGAGSPGVAAASVEQHVEGLSIPDDLDGVLGAKGGQGSDVLVGIGQVLGLSSSQGCGGVVAGDLAAEGLERLGTADDILSDRLTMSLETLEADALEGADDFDAVGFVLVDDSSVSGEHTNSHKGGEDMGDPHGDGWQRELEGMYKK